MKYGLMSLMVLALSGCPDKGDQTTGDSHSQELEPKICTAEVKECGDGSFVGRDPSQDCEFKTCPEK